MGEGRTHPASIGFCIRAPEYGKTTRKLPRQARVEFGWNRIKGGCNALPLFSRRQAGLCACDDGCALLRATFPAARFEPGPTNPVDSGRRHAARFQAWSGVL